VSLLTGGKPSSLSDTCTQDDDDDDDDDSNTSSSRSSSSHVHHAVSLMHSFDVDLPACLDDNKWPPRYLTQM